MNESVRFGRIIRVGARIDGSERNAANPAFHGCVDVSGDELEVILKFEPPHRLAKELIAVSVASRVGIAHAPGLIGLVRTRDFEQLRDVSPVSVTAGEVCYASEKSPGWDVLQDYDKFLPSPFAIDLLVFDQLIANQDRVRGNILEHGHGFRAFDHDKILFFDEAKWTELPASAPVGSLTGDDIASRRASSLELAKRTAEQFRASMQAEPLDFLEEITKIGLFTESDAAAVHDFLMRRSAVLPSVVEHYFEQNTG
jgi:hypothetical protein|uniref:hypothetical protein n=1 Tax=uncultured Acidovorax sp. TaxID=158751 RepID=UPI0025E18635|nr:hypothetical protein [uncultured Acidovorax sp.]